MLMQMNPVAITIKGISIRWYSIFILIAFIVVYLLVRRESWRFRINKDFIFNIAFWTFIGGILGARVWYVLFNIKDYLMNPVSILFIWEGGLAIHGGILGGFIAICLFCKKYKFRIIRILDFVAPALLLGQAIGRWGNFFNGEAHGYATTALVLQKWFIPKFIIKGMTINGVVYMPTFLFESFACLIVFIIFMFVRRYKYLKVGTMTALYLITYGIIRFIIEFQRTDALMIGPIRIAQVLSVIFFVIGLAILIYNSRKGKLDDLYNDYKNVPELKY